MESYKIISSGEKLKTIRKKYGLKQEELAGAEITRNLISQIEHNKAKLTKKAAQVIFKNLQKICNTRNISVEVQLAYLIEDEKDQANKILNEYIKELKDLTVYKDTSFSTKLTEVEKFLSTWNFIDKKIIIFELAGDYFCSIDDFYNSSIYYEKAKALADLDIHDNHMLSILRKLSMVYFYMGKYEYNIKCCEFAMDRFDHMSEEYFCIFLFNSALCYTELKEYDKAIRNLNKLEKTIKNTNTDKYYQVLLQKSLCLQYIGKYEESLTLYNKVLKSIDEKSYDKYVLSFINISEIYLNLGEYDKARETSNKIMEYIVYIDENYKNMPRFYFEIGKIFKRLKAFDTSEKYFLKSLELSKKYTHYYLIKDILCELVEVYKTQNNLDGIAYIKSQFFILTGKDNSINLAIMYKLLGFYLEIDDIQSLKEIYSFTKNFV
ncbi:XRE family transcriptional regulator [Clostridium acetobutylicum]|nr:XRE family transcriptional regulator [Clostridium acetobutylicum]